MIKQIFLLSCIILLTGCEISIEGFEPIQQDTGFSEQGLVTKVVDGDTIDVDINGTITRIRLICVDTPERGKTNFSEATNFTKSLVLGKVVGLEKDISETDRYGRSLRYVYVDNVSVNLELIKYGLARPYRYKPDVKHCDEYEASRRDFYKQ